MDDGHVLRAVFDADEPIVIRVRHELAAHQRRLLAALGAGYVVDEDAPPCGRACGWEECTVSARQTERVSGMPLSMASLGARSSVDWSPNWIDYRHSIVLVESRRDRGETVEICRECGCEVDVSPVPHSPRCPTLVEASTNGNGSVADGRELLDRMDAGEALTSESDDSDVSDDGLEEAPEPNGAGSGASLSSSEPGPVEPAPAPEGDERPAGDGASSNGRKPKWTREKVIAAIREVAQKVGRTPSGNDMRAAGYGGAYQVSTFQRLDTTWPELIQEAGFEPRARGKNADTRPETQQARPDDLGRSASWTADEVLDAIRRWAADHGQPPTSDDWTPRVDGYPSAATAARRFGSWAEAVERAGFDRPQRGGHTRQPVQQPARRVRVHGTGLTYRTAAEAYVAAEEIEADGERVAEQARFDGNEAKAEQAIDQSRELADKIRFAASAFEERTGGHSSEREPLAEEDAPGADTPALELPVAPPLGQAGEAASRSDDHLLVKPEEMPAFQQALVRGVIAGMRAAADALEQELSA